LINIQALALNLLLSCEDKQSALDAYEQVRVDFFSGMYHDVFRAVIKYYNENGAVPTLQSLAVKFSRNQKIQTAVSALSQVDSSGIDLDLAIEALRDEYAQQETLKLIQANLLARISMLSSIEIVDILAAIPLEIENKLQHTGLILTQKDIPVFQNQELLDYNAISTGISNKFDNELGGLGRQEVMLLGGRRGGGKSVMCANIVAHQYKQGKVAPYYTIEMTGRETLLRILSILADVCALEVKRGTLSGEPLLRFARTRAEMFVGGLELYHQFIESRGAEPILFSDFSVLDTKLVKLPMSHPLIIVDDPGLKLSTIDVSLSKLRGLYGELVTFAIVDYLNEVKLEGRTDPYDWVYQKEVATGLKNLARKHDCGIVAPFQVDDTGEARFSKAILDPIDIAFVLTGNKAKKNIIMQSTKLRSLPDTVLKIGMDWDTLATNPVDLEIEDADFDNPKDTKKRTKKKPENDDPNPSDDKLGADAYEL
jgi:replicative DNA helicase